MNFLVVVILSYTINMLYGNTQLVNVVTMLTCYVTHVYSEWLVTCLEQAGQVLISNGVGRILSNVRQEMANLSKSVSEMIIWLKLNFITLSIPFLNEQTFGSVTNIIHRQIVSSFWIKKKQTSVCLVQLQIWKPRTRTG